MLFLAAKAWSDLGLKFVLLRHGVVLRSLLIANRLPDGDRGLARSKVLFVREHRVVPVHVNIEREALSDLLTLCFDLHLHHLQHLVEDRARGLLKHAEALLLAKVLDHLPKAEVVDQAVVIDPVESIYERSNDLMAFLRLHHVLVAITSRVLLRLLVVTWNTEADEVGLLEGGGKDFEPFKWLELLVLVREFLLRLENDSIVL